ncbi:MAG: hypothetical protein NUV45_13660 [Tepidanaerobacteraceae bacterium]|jgi:hypothetical protein|nr:hypothetical protein [Tepidanaerobacteraceae bacterium]
MSKKTVWGIFVIYLIILTQLAFGAHSETFDKGLCSIGLKEPATYYVPPHEETVGDTFTANLFHTRIGEVIQVPGGMRQNGYRPNYGGFIAFVVGGAFIAFISSKPPEKKP